MSTTITVPSRDLRDCFSTLALIAHKGSQLTPASLILQNGKLTFICLQGCVVQSSLSVPCDEIANLVFMFHDVTPIMPPSGNVDVALFDYGVVVTGEDFSCQFPLGYSDVTEYDFSECRFTQIENNAYLDNLRIILAMNLDKLYGKPVPFTLFENVAVVKHSCCYIQTRTYGIPFQAQIDPEHIKMLIRLKPYEVSDTIPDTLVFRKGSNVLQIPCRSRVDENDFMLYMEQLKVVGTVSASKLYERVNYSSKIGSKSRCRIHVTESGIKITTNSDNASSSVSNGDMSKEITFTAMFPIPVLLAFFRAIGDSQMEILAGGELFCLRTQNLIILVRVEY